jgi:hypothetical protein
MKIYCVSQSSLRIVCITNESNGFSLIERAVTCEKYAQAVHHFLSAGPDHGARVDFKTRNLVGIGHSLGSVSMCVSAGL